ncbi:MAG: NAD-dependent epimerase/dehydratase family protein [Deltaproteobacteria bacterium]|nr:NAD-dependent epimerase/dehydratase family protein [Deltaproteobacteria bacterium]
MTGGAGFIGSQLAERLVAEGHKVLIYDAFTKQYPAATKRRHVAAALGLPGCSLIEGDVLEAQRFESVFSAQAVDAIVHLAAYTGPVTPDTARTALEANVLGLFNVLERGRKHSVGRFIYLSSGAVYGLRHQGPCKETDPADRPLSAYAASKKAGESLAWLAHQQHGVEVAVLRAFAVYGPRQRPDQMIHRIARKLLAAEPLELPGDGTQVFDFVYVDDAVDAVVRALEAAKGFEVLNVGSGRGTTLLELVDRLGAVAGLVPTVTFGPPDPTIPPVSLADVAKAERLLGWRPATELDDGLRRMFGWMRAEEFADEA